MCYDARAKSFKLFNKFLENNNAEIKQRYIQANLYYKILCKETKKEFYELPDHRIGEVQGSKQ